MTDNIANISADKALSALRAYVRTTNAYELDLEPLSLQRRRETFAAISALLCDLRHLCEREDVSFDEASRVAAKYHAEEIT